MTTKTIKTVLFASLIAAMILPFSGMNYAEADTANAEHQAKKDKLKADKKSFQEERDRTVNTDKKNKLGKIIDRITLFEELEDLLVGEQTKQTEKRIQKIYDTLQASYTADENGLVASHPEIEAFENIIIPAAYAIGTGSYTTSTQYRGDCNHSQYGWLSGTYVAYDQVTVFSQTWNYPTAIYDGTGNCNTTWDFEDNWSTVFGYQVYCPYNTVFLTASYNCSVGDGTYVTFWSNADFDGPLNPPAQQSFTQLPGVTTKVL